MYEDKQRKIKINWKSLLIKMVILLVVIFLILWFISIINKKKQDVPSNIGTNLKIMQEAASEYFTGSKLPENLNGKVSITLKEMIDSKLIIEFKDQNGKACDLTNSYAEATKVSDEDYTIKVKLVCGKENDYVIDTIKVKNNSNDPVIDNNEDNNQDNNQDNSSGDSTSNGSTSNSSTNTKPSTSTKPSTTPSTTPSTSNPGTNNKPTNTTTCTYGNKEYISNYPLAYEISGNCAVSKDDYFDYGSKVNPIGTKEYTKIKDEVRNLANETGTSLYVETPIYTGVYNKANTGLVGYQIKFVVKQKLTYTTKVIYEYFIDSNGNRKAVIDNRASLKVTNNNNSNTSSSLSITLNTYAKTMNVGDTYQLIASVNQSNKTIYWSTSNANIVSVSQNGYIRATGTGTATIKATVDGKGVAATITVVNSNEAVTGVTLNTDAKTMYVGDTFQLKATITPSSASNKEITWVSADSNIASISSSGVVKAVSAGSVMVWAIVDGKTAYAVITVLDKQVTRVEIVDNDLELSIGDTHKLQYKVYPDGAIYNKRVYFYVDNASVIKVEDGVIKAVGVGKTKLTVTVDGKSDYIYVTVREV